jgi:hypothetical protein
MATKTKSTGTVYAILEEESLYEAFQMTVAGRPAQPALRSTDAMMFHHANQPPSTANTSPVTKDASSDARNKAA